LTSWKRTVKKISNFLPVFIAADNETFEKCSILFKAKSKIPDFEREKAKILTTGIH